MKVKGGLKTSSEIQVAARRVSGHFSLGSKRVQFFIIFRGGAQRSASESKVGGSCPPSPLIPTPQYMEHQSHSIGCPRMSHYISHYHYGTQSIT